jgi:cold shock protein
MLNSYNNRTMAADTSLQPAQRGVICSWHDDRGFGFIRLSEPGYDVFVHIKSVRGGYASLSVGDRVTYEVGTNAKNGKTEAKNVELLD